MLRWTGVLLLLLVTVSATTFAQTTSPTTAPAPPTSQPFPSAQFMTGYSALLAGQPDDALKIFQDIARSQPKMPLNPKLLSDDQVNLLHCTAVAYMRMGDNQKAREPMDRAFDAKRGNRSIEINRATLDVMYKANAVRAAGLLARILLNEQSPDEKLVNLFGIALDRASDSASGARSVKKLIDDYDRVNALLERTRPKYKRWGTQWVSQTEYDIIQSRRRQQQDSVRFYENRAEKSQLAVDRAKRDLDSAQSTIYRADETNVRADRIRHAQDYLAKKQQALDHDTADLTAAQSRVEKPDWVDDIKPVVPDLALKDE